MSTNASEHILVFKSNESNVYVDVNFIVLKQLMTNQSRIPAKYNVYNYKNNVGLKNIH